MKRLLAKLIVPMMEINAKYAHLSMVAFLACAFILTFGQRFFVQVAFVPESPGQRLMCFSLAVIVPYIIAFVVAFSVPKRAVCSGTALGSHVIAGLVAVFFVASSFLFWRTAGSAVAEGASIFGFLIPIVTCPALVASAVEAANFIKPVHERQ